MPSFSLAGWIYLVAFGLLVPWAAWRTRQQLQDGPNPPRQRHFVAVILQLLLFLGFSLWVARLEGIAVPGPFALRWLPLAATIVLLGGGILLMAPRWRRSVEARERNVHLFMPRTGGERALWVGVSAAAAVSEEVTYRGVLFALLGALTGQAWLAAGLASVIFGVSHAVQGWKSAGIIAGVALVLHGLVAWSGSLHLAIAAHFLYDLIAGLAYGRLGHELGYPEHGIPPHEEVITS